MNKRDILFFRNTIFILTGLFIILAVISSCGGDSGNSDGDNGTGKISIRAVFPDLPEHTNSFNAGKALNCPEHGIDTVEGYVYNASNQEKGKEIWSCGAHSGTISGIPVGSNYTVILLGKNGSDEVIYLGEVSGISVTSNQPAKAVVVTELFIPTLSFPSSGYRMWLCDISQLEWNEVAGAQEYQILISESSDMSNATMITTSKIGHLPSGLNENTTYYWQVKALDSRGNLGLGSEIYYFHSSKTNILIDISDRTSSSYPSEMIVVNDILYFRANDGSGSQLWKFDGFSYEKIVINAEGGSYPSDFIEFDNKLYFTANDGSDNELWRYDGSSADKIDINGTGSSYPSSLTIYDGSLYFAATVNSDEELYKFNGTIATPIDIYAGGSSNPRHLTVASGLLYFEAYDGTDWELYKYDGLTSTKIDINTNPSESSYPYNLTESNNNIYFVAEDGTDTELYEYNGTNYTKIDICPASCSSYPANLTDVNGSLYFSASDETDTELFMYDTVTGSAKKIDINTNPNASSYPNNLANIDGTLYFSAEWASIGREPSSYNGTSAEFLKDINDGTSGSWPSGFSEINGVVYFRADNGSQNGSELWSYDESIGTAKLEEDICVGSCSSYLSNMTPVVLNGIPTIFYRADDGVNGSELWSTTSAGTALVADINEAGSGTPPRQLTSIGGRLYFSADDGTNGAELWESDGTSFGTQMVIDINPGSESSNPKYFIEFNGNLYFRASNGSDTELWQYDGIDATEIEIDPSGSSYPYGLTVVNDVLYFSATKDADTELWKYDGKDLTEIVVNSSDSSYPGTLTDVNGILYFVATSGSDKELYKYDGSTLTKINVNPLDSSYPYQITAVDSNVYFLADGGNGYNLWEYNGTSLTEININAGGSSYPGNLTEMGGNLYFTATNGVQYDLYKYEGGTYSKIDVITAGERFFRGMRAVNNSLYCLVEPSDTNKFQLWKSNGETSGTKLVKDLGTSSYYYLEDTAGLDEKFYFVLFEGYYDVIYEVWESDGTGPNTIKLAENTDWNIPYFEPELEILGGALFFTHFNSQYGPELWKHCP